MKQELKDSWVEIISGLDIPAGTMYLLLKPINRETYLKTIDELQNQFFKLRHDGSVDMEKAKIFRSFAILYLIEFEEDNCNFIPASSLITYPNHLTVTKTNIPGYPTVPANSQDPIIYNTTVA